MSWQYSASVSQRSANIATNSKHRLHFPLPLQFTNEKSGENIPHKCGTGAWPETTSGASWDAEQLTRSSEFLFPQRSRWSRREDGRSLTPRRMQHGTSLLSKMFEVHKCKHIPQILLQTSSPHSKVQEVQKHSSKRQSISLKNTEKRTRGSSEFEPTQRRSGACARREGWPGSAAARRRRARDLLFARRDLDASAGGEPIGRTAPVPTWVEICKLPISV